MSSPAVRFLAGLFLLAAAALAPYVIYRHSAHLVAAMLFHGGMDPAQISLLADHVGRHYVDVVPRDELMRQALRGMVSGLDPYSVYVDEEDQEDFNHVTEGSFTGIGVLLGSRGGHSVILQVFEGGPAEKAGLKADDVFVRIGGRNVEAVENAEEIKKLVKGLRGTSVEIEIWRPLEEQSHVFVVMRDVVPIPSVSVKRLEGDVLHAALTQFHKLSAEQLREKISEEIAKGGAPKGLILDLRGNGGGLLDVAVKVCGLFLPAHSVVVKELRRSDDPGLKHEEVEHRTAGEDGPWKDLPLAVLVDGRSASASEIVAGCLQDLHRAGLWGERTFGKGLVQELLPLQDGQASLKLTVARYLTPSGRWLQSGQAGHYGGIQPDYAERLDEVGPARARLRRAWADAAIDADLDEILKKHGRRPAARTDLAERARRRLLSGQKP